MNIRTASQSIKAFLSQRYVRKVARQMQGAVPRQCNLCGYSGYFSAYGYPPRYDALCPQCQSLERHRLLGLWVADNQHRIAAMHILHFAPEPAVRRMFESGSSKYVPADYVPSGDSIMLNIENIDKNSEEFDIVICSHVLEHVDHEKALRELHRILKPGGLTILMFPIVEGWDETYTNPSISTDEGRELHFGQFDHIRFFGRNIRNDIRNAGFLLEEFTAIEPFVSCYGLVRGEKVFLATKQLVA